MFCFWWLAIIGSSGTAARVSIRSSASAATGVGGMATAALAAGVGGASREQAATRARLEASEKGKRVIWAFFLVKLGGLAGIQRVDEQL